MPYRNNNPIIHTPRGALRRSDVVGLTPDEMKFFRDFHRIAQKYDLGLHCSSCQQDIQGGNTGHEHTLTLSCGCREFRGERPRD